MSRKLIALNKKFKTRLLKLSTPWKRHKNRRRNISFRLQSDLKDSIVVPLVPSQDLTLHMCISRLSYRVFKNRFESFEKIWRSKMKKSLSWKEHTMRKPFKSCQSKIQTYRMKYLLANKSCSNKRLNQRLLIILWLWKERYPLFLRSKRKKFWERDFLMKQQIQGFLRVHRETLWVKTLKSFKKLKKRKS